MKKKWDKIAHIKACSRNVNGPIKCTKVIVDKKTKSQIKRIKGPDRNDPDLNCL